MISTLRRTLFSRRLSATPRSVTLALLALAVNLLQPSAKPTSDIGIPQKPARPPATLIFNNATRPFFSSIGNSQPAGQLLTFHLNSHLKSVQCSSRPSQPSPSPSAPCPSRPLLRPRTRPPSRPRLSIRIPLSAQAGAAVTCAATARAAGQRALRTISSAAHFRDRAVVSVTVQLQHGLVSDPRSSHLRLEQGLEVHLGRLVRALKNTCVCSQIP